MEIVQAIQEDWPHLLRHRVEMFRDMGWSDEDLQKTEKVVKEDLKQGIDQNSIFYLVKEGNRVIAGCGIAIVKILPTHRNLSGKFAYVYNLYVEQEYRRKGIASKLMRYIEQECTRMGVTRLYLHASEKGRKVYEKIGYTRPENFYELRKE